MLLPWSARTNSQFCSWSSVQVNLERYRFRHLCSIILEHCCSRELLPALISSSQSESLMYVLFNGQDCWLYGSLVPSDFGLVPICDIYCGLKPSIPTPFRLRTEHCPVLSSRLAPWISCMLPSIQSLCREASRGSICIVTCEACCWIIQWILWYLIILKSHHSSEDETWV